MSEKFETLDALRGVAAIGVVVWHAEVLFGWRPQSGYLAVDLFFMLSGFVIAHAYDARLAQGMGVARFMMLRGIRLYPLYGLGTAISIVGLLAAFAIGAHSNWTPGSLFGSALLGSLFLPSIAANGTLYPLNPPAWSLLFELIVNFVFAAGIAYLTIRRLFLIAFLSFVVLVAATVWFGDLNTGWKWADFIGALPRVFFAFPIGMALCRLHRDHGWKIAVNPIVPIAAVAALLTFSAPRQGIYDLATVLFAFPTIVLAGASRGMPGWGRLATFLGTTSYAIYALHLPLLSLFTRAASLIPGPALPAPAGGIVFLILALLAAWIADTAWDKPVRAWMTRRLVPART